MKCNACDRVNAAVLYLKLLHKARGFKPSWVHLIFVETRGSTRLYIGFSM